MNAFVTIENDDTLFFGRPHQAAVVTARMKRDQRRREGSRGKAGAGLGLASLAVLLGACGTGGDGAGGVAPGPVTGRVVKDYVAGTEVFDDANGNGVRDAGEQGATTGADGSFTVSDFSGILSATGGVDTGSGVSLDGVLLQAPAGATVITPLTTLMVAGASQADVLAAFGLAAGLDLATYDAQAGFTAGDADAAAVLAAGQTAMISIRAIAALTGDSFIDSAARLAGAMTGGALDLTDTSVVQGLLTGLDATLASRAADLIAGVNSAVMDQTGAPLGSGMQAASLLGQTLLLADLERFAAHPTDELWSQLQARYDDASLGTLLAGATDALPGAAGSEVVTGTDFVDVTAGQPVTFDAADLLDNDVSLDGDALTLTGVSVDPTRAGEVTVVFDAATGAVTVTPGAGFSGVSMFEYSGTDAEGNAFTGVVLVNVDSALITGGVGDDVLNGDDGRNVLIGGDGDDALFGAGADDRLIALVGADALDGGSGNDMLVAAGTDGAEVVMRGGSGDDLFILAPVGAGDGLDVSVFIVDFASGEDQIDLSGLRDADGSLLTIDDVLGHASMIDGNTVIDLGDFVTADGAAVDAAVTLTGVDTASLGAADFVLEAGVVWQAGVEDLLSTSVPA